MCNTQLSWTLVGKDVSLGENSSYNGLEMKVMRLFWLI